MKKICLIFLVICILACKSNSAQKTETISATHSATHSADDGSLPHSTEQENSQASPHNDNTGSNTSPEKKTGNSAGTGGSGGSSGNSGGDSGTGTNTEIITETQSAVVHSDLVRIKERSDYRTYINGKYSGLTYREAETYLQQKKLSSGTAFSGKAFVVQDTRRNLVSQAKRLDEAVDISYIKKRDGSEVFSIDPGFPLLRSFFDTLALDYETIPIGSWWETASKVSVLPLKESKPIILPVLIRYEYAGLASYLENPVYKVVGKYALRYNGEPEFTAISGTRDIEVYLDRNTKNIVFVREKTLEQFTYKDGKTVKNDGTLLHFYEYRGFDKTLITTTDNSIVGIHMPDTTGNGSDGSENQGGGTGGGTHTVDFSNSDTYTVENTDLGLQLRLQNLRFVADQAILLPGEEQKLDEIASILERFSGKMFFVEGHTAATGRPNDEKLLSEQRAQHIVAELVKRNLPAQNFLYSGAGATKPIADNATDNGKAKNRRVEITILD